MDVAGIGAAAPILVVNAGSSSLKLSLLGAGDAPLAERDLEGGGQIAIADLRSALESAGPLLAVGHRVVHGGDRYRGPVLIDGSVVRYLRSLTDLAPLHQPAALAAIREVSRLLPGTPAVACFDTSFHHTLPAAAATFAVPRAWRRRWSIRRYGFHGLSHAHASRRAAELAGRSPSEVRVVSCHLGSGASLAAVAGGRSVDTTMGFTPLDGLVMATRAGSLDPGLLLFLLGRGGITQARLSEALEHRSGLLALSGTADMRRLGAVRGGADALAVYLHRLRAQIAAMAAAMDGLDLLVFTGGVGENSAAVRSGAAAGLGFLGVALEEDAGGQGDREISAAGARVRSFVVHAREDLEIARQVRSILTPNAPLT